MSQSYATRLAAAQRRREKVLDRLQAAREALAEEDARIYLLTAHVEAGAGHVLLPDPPIRLWPGAWPEKGAPACRVCGADITSITGKKPCAGDTRSCPAPVDVESETTYRRYEDETGYRCGAAGSYAADFFSWTCMHGHETRVTAASEHDRRRCSHDRSQGYQLQGCLGDCPSRGLNVTIGSGELAGIGPS